MKKENPMLISGLLELDGRKEVSINHAWKYCVVSDKFYANITIHSKNNNKIPKNSDWFIVTSDNYPDSNVKLYPSVNNCFSETYEHQNNNGKIEENGLWRTGSLCLDSDKKSFKRFNDEPEPQNYRNKILWNVSRTIKWIDYLNNDKLVTEEDSFELPDFNERKPYFVYSEDENSFLEWKNLENDFGVLELGIHKFGGHKFYMSNSFKDFKNNNILNQLEWGRFLSNPNEITHGIWILLDKIPVVNQWQAPNSMYELNQNVNILNQIKKVIENNNSLFRDGKKHLLVLGFKIPEKIGGDEILIHWQPILMDILTKSGKKGFRNSNSLWYWDKRKIFNSKNNIYWLKSQNWNDRVITNRGTIKKEIKQKNTLVIGGGTLGSSIAELLTRLGMKKLTIQDYDTLEVGNLSRHTLKIPDISGNKSEYLCSHLNEINPNINVEFNNEEFCFKEEFTKKIDEFDLIIDCSADDNVLFELEKFEFNNDKIFASVSIGFDVEKLFLAMQKGMKFNSNHFLDEVKNWVDEEIDKISKINLTRDEARCWNVIFPGRYDDILMAASVAVKSIEKFIETDYYKITKVYKKSVINDFIGFEQIKMERI